MNRELVKASNKIRTKLVKKGFHGIVEWTDPIDGPATLTVTPHGEDPDNAAGCAKIAAKYMPEF